MPTQNLPPQPNIQPPQQPEMPLNEAQIPVTTPPPVPGALQTLQTLASVKTAGFPIKKLLIAGSVVLLLIIGTVIVVLAPQKKWGLGIPNEGEQKVLPELREAQKEPTNSAGLRVVNYPYVGNNPFLPERLRVYKMHTDHKISITAGPAQTIAETFLFEGDPKTTTSEDETEKYEWYNSLLDKLLVINTKTGEVCYTWGSGWKQATPSYSLAEYESSAARFLTSREVPTKFLTTATHKTGYLKTTERGWESTNKKQEAHGVQVFFEYQISGLPLAGYYFGKEPVQVIMDADKSIVNLSYILFDNSRVTLVDEYLAKDLDTALVELTEGEKTLVYRNNRLINDTEFIKLTANLKQGRLVAVYPAYFQSTEETKILQPIFIFEGEGEIAGETVEFQVYLPAVK